MTEHNDRNARRPRHGASEERPLKPVAPLGQVGPAGGGYSGKRVRTDGSLRQLFTTGDYAWSLTYREPQFEIVGRPTAGLLVVYGAHRTLDGAIRRARAHLDML